MSTADDAYTEFWESKGFPAPSSGPDRAAFMFAYRRALEDAQQVIAGENSLAWAKGRMGFQRCAPSCDRTD